MALPSHLPTSHGGERVFFQFNGLAPTGVTVPSAPPPHLGASDSTAGEVGPFHRHHSSLSFANAFDGLKARLRRARRRHPNSRDCCQTRAARPEAVAHPSHGSAWPRRRPLASIVESPNVRGDTCAEMLQGGGPVGSMFGRFGSPSRTRTCDKAINSRLLYQLSYRGSPGRLGGAGGSLAFVDCRRKGPRHGFLRNRPGFVPPPCTA